MSKYVLNSGGIKGYPDKASLYTNELLKDLPQSPNILLCFFASDPKTWDDYFTEWKDHFHTWSPDYDPEFQLATADNFAEQCRRADVIYIHGGYLELMCPITDTHNLENLFADKVVGLNSASSHLISKHFWSVDSLTLGNGLGILPIKFFAHFRADDFVHTPIDWDQALEELKGYGDPSLPIYALEEGEFVVINK